MIQSISPWRYLKEDVKWLGSLIRRLFDFAIILMVQWKDLGLSSLGDLDLTYVSDCLLGLYLWPKGLAFLSFHFLMYKTKIELIFWNFERVKRHDAHKWLIQSLAQSRKSINVACFTYFPSKIESLKCLRKKVNLFSYSLFWGERQRWWTLVVSFLSSVDVITLWMSKQRSTIFEFLTNL